jgi:hypothetical protein
MFGEGSLMTKKETLEVARLRERVAQLEGLIEQVVRLHYPERWKALELKNAITWGQETLASLEPQESA